MATRAAVYDFTLIDAAGNPLFGTMSSGVITESDFQTPDDTLSHDRPWLRAPTNFTGPEVDFARGSSRIGAVTVSVVDVRGTATDQTTGQLTAQIKNTKGIRAVLRRYDQTAAAWLTIFDGVVHSYTVDSGELVVYNFHLRDGREFEREGELFESNFVLWGEDGKSGPLIDYGVYPVMDFLVDTSFSVNLLDGVEPFESTTEGGINHFERLNAASPTDGIYFGYASTISTNGNLQLPDLGWPTQRKDGLYYYEDFKIRWRAKGTEDPWVTLTEMPAASYKNAIVQFDGGTAQQYGASSGDPAIYFASTDPTEVPSDDQEIEFQVLAIHITEETPFFWDGGTVGDLLQEIVNGDHTDSVPQEQYDSSALTSFAASSPKARFILRQPVKDRRKWVEENIYQPAFSAPAFNTSQEITPTSWFMPANSENIPILDADTIQPVGEYEDGTELAIGRVEYTYIREHLDPLDTIIKKESPPWWQFWEDDTVKEVPDPEDTRRAWERLVEKEITVDSEASDAVPGAKTLTYAPITIRSTAGVDGSPFLGDVQSELGNRLAGKAFNTVLPRFKSGAARYVAEVVATDENLNIAVGDWLRVRVDWLPEYDTGKRGMRRYMQVYKISEVSPALRELYLVDGGVPDPTGDTDLVTGTDCFTGGTAFPAPDGSTLRFFENDGTLTNSCGTAQTVTLLAIAGGGGGGDAASKNAGGGGGAGGVLEVEVTINPGEAIPVRVGSGGAADNDGENTVLWVDGNGDALDPATDPEPSATAAIGGGAGGGNEDPGEAGGSGGGAGANGSTGSGQSGGSGTTGQGNDGGNSTGNGGSSSCRQAAGGGGGSFAAAGADGSLSGGAAGGAGGASSTLSDYGVTAGGGGQGGASRQAGTSGSCSDPGEYSTPGDSGTGRGFGGGGGANGTSGKSGGTGFLLVKYAGAEQTLSAPDVTSTDTTDENQVEICVEEADWPEIDLDGYRVKVEYAVGDAEPDADSTDWQLAGYLEAPGCVYTDSVPTGTTVWHRVTAEADDFLPSDPGTAGSDATPETAGLLRLELRLDDNGIVTATWIPNDFCVSVTLRAEVHESGDTLSDPLPLIDTVSASDLSYVFNNLALAKTQFLTLDVVCFDAPSGGGTEGITHRASIERVKPTLATADDVDNALDDLVFNNDLGLVLDNDLIPVKGGTV